MESKHFRLYRAEPDGRHYLGKLTAFLADRPGSLAELAGLFAKHSVNITFFHYNRSEHPNRVVLEVTGAKADSVLSAGREMLESGISKPDFSTPELKLGLLDTESILNLEARIRNSPGALGAFAERLRDHGANVIYMSYNEDISENSAVISIATSNPAEIDLLLKDLNNTGYHYSLIYKGAAQKEIDDVIGLNLVERFFFKMKRLLNTDDLQRLKKLAESSQRISETLAAFSREAGKDLEAGNVFTGVLAFASASLSRTGEKFTFRRLSSIGFGDVEFHCFRLPTGGNIIILESGSESVMIDGGYGLYYEDVKNMLYREGIDPSKIKRIFLSHADCDHAGMSGGFAGEFGSCVYLHRRAAQVMANANRAWGSNTPYLDLNGYFTVLADEFTDSKPPRNWYEYGGETRGTLSGFSVIDYFELAGQKYQVIESLGGHVPGQVFFASEDSGLIFTGDYLLAIDSLSPEEREILSYPKRMMISTNVDSALFRREMELLRKMVADLDTRIKPSGLRATVIPGHGDYYRWDNPLV